MPSEGGRSRHASSAHNCSLVLFIEKKRRHIDGEKKLQSTRQKKEKDKTVFTQKWGRKEPGKGVLCCCLFLFFFVKSQTAQLAAGNCEQCAGSKCSSCMSVEYIPLQRHPSQRTNSGATTGPTPTHKHRQQAG